MEHRDGGGRGEVKRAGEKEEEKKRQRKRDFRREFRREKEYTECSVW